MHPLQVKSGSPSFLSLLFIRKTHSLFHWVGATTSPCVMSVNPCFLQPDHQVVFSLRKPIRKLEILRLNRMTQHLWLLWLCPSVCYLTFWIWRSEIIATCKWLSGRFPIQLSKSSFAQDDHSPVCLIAHVNHLGVNIQAFVFQAYSECATQHSVSSIFYISYSSPPICWKWW